MKWSLMPAELVVVDLDDTLWPWCRSWHAGFTAFNTVLEHRGATLGEAEDCWSYMYDRRQGATIEFPPDVEDLQRYIWPESSVNELGSIHFDAFNAAVLARSDALGLFPGVKETLTLLKESGIPVVAHTDSPLTAAEARLHATRLDGLVEELHARPIFEHFGPVGALEQTTVVVTSGWEGKPSTRVLSEILRARNVNPAKTLYVGDSKRRDIPMALNAGCVGVWAQYGVSYPERDPAVEALLQVQRFRPFPAEQSLEADAENGVGDVRTIQSFSEVADLALNN